MFSYLWRKVTQWTVVEILKYVHVFGFVSEVEKRSPEFFAGKSLNIVSYMLRRWYKDHEKYNKYASPLY
jgi:hypothetical protein